MKRTFATTMLAAGILLLGLPNVQAQDSMTARGIIEANIEATGGLSAWRDVADMKMEADIDFAIPQMGSLILKLESWSMFPGYGYTSIDLLDGPPAVPADQVNQKAYYTPLEGWVESAAGRTNLNDLPEAQRRQFQRASPKSELEFLNLPDSALVLVDDVVIDSTAYYAINVTMNGIESKFLFDKETKYLMGQETMTPMGPIMSMMSNHREVNGFVFPFLQTADLGAQGMQTITFTKIELNSGLTPDAIAKKAGVSKAVVAPE